MSADKAAEILLGGGVIAYPTEGVFGLGCRPDDAVAIQRVLTIKRRDPAKGLILLASAASQLDGWMDLPDTTALPDPQPDHPITWIVPAGRKAGYLVRGEHDGVAVRITTNPTAQDICRIARCPIVSTSANLSGQPVAADQDELQRQFGDLVDYIVPGECGPATGPSEIRDFQSGAVLRPR